MSVGYHSGYGGGGGGSDQALGAVIWRPGAAGDGYVTTWAEVMTKLSETRGEFTVWLDSGGGGSFDIPANTYDGQGRLVLARTAPAEGQLTVVMADGAVLQDLAAIRRNVTLQGNSTAAAALEVTDGGALELDLGAILENAGTYPMLEIAGNESATLNLYRDSSLNASGAEIVDLLAAGATMTARFEGASTATADWITGNASASLTVQADSSSYSAVSLASAPGSVQLTRTASYANLSGTVVAWETDFTSMASVNMLTDGNYVVTPNVEGSAVTWTAANQGALTERQIINGTGLKWTTTAVAATFSGSTRASGYLDFSLGDLSSDFDYSRMRWRCFAQLDCATVPGGSSYAGAYIGVWTTVVNNLIQAAGRTKDAFAVECVGARGTGTNTDILLPALVQNAPDDVVLVVGSQGGMQVASGLYSGGWPAPAALTPYWYVNQNNNTFQVPAATNLHSGLRGFLSLTNGNIAGVFDGVIKRVRYEIELS